MRISTAGALILACGLIACGKQDHAQVTAASADQFIKTVNAELLTKRPLWNAAGWVAATYITEDTQRLSAAATEEGLAFDSRNIEEAKRYNSVTGLAPDTARSLLLIKLGSSMPAPKDAAKRAELAKIATKMEANYGSAKWCAPDKSDNARCLTLQEIEKIIDNSDFSHSPKEIATAWSGWHATAKPIRADYRRFVELMNEGAKEIGFADTGELWRGGYDMTPAEFDREVERLWSQVQPLYEQLHCTVRAKLNEKYGDDVVPEHGPIPAHLLGNMWAQQWGHLYPLLEPYKSVANTDISSSLKALRDADYQQRLKAYKGKPSAIEQSDMAHAADGVVAEKMTHIAEDFYTSLGLPHLPDSFWKKSLLVRPRDRDVQCHASAWDLDLNTADVRIKQCIEPTEAQLTTIHHELGHIFYYLAYKDQTPLFQRGAHDGFHEAIGDTVTLSLTPAHLQKIGLVKEARTDERALINSQMKLALDKIVFLPWGKLVDQWRWKVFSGEIRPEQYNKAWWALREKYQGVAAPVARGPEDFDPGAKYHVAGNTPYTRYFLAFVLQFQFHKALCEAAGHHGPLAQCDIYGNKAAGEKFQAMLAAGGSQPWQDTLEKLTGSRQMDASAIIEYFQPLMSYLAQQNQGRSCGWDVKSGI
ncbi:M2 family metallopeptidase [Methylococcus sp. EFPC2]|uniref:M2 family metallopeptidase n=1 Tax=Methylococcus sp. EFPC2 TaxID=2812648 RepID=UPI0019687F51|nr:M2 family metallopeptidase [Methylococcus sp. EFPC2]QSA98160.1 M2 family metallopeptidase [Methylococcus sp. EFPC2]